MAPLTARYYQLGLNAKRVGGARFTQVVVNAVFSERVVAAVSCWTLKLDPETPSHLGVVKPKST
jgi:hypothetical protein